MRVVVFDDDGTEMLSLEIAKTSDEAVGVLLPALEERPLVIAALAEAISIASPPLRELPEANITYHDGRAGLPRPRPSLKVVE